MSRQMSTRRDKLPDLFARPMQGMEVVRQGNMIAFDYASEVFAYNFNRAASTLAFAGLVYKAAQASGLPPGAEEGFRELTKEYLNTARSIQHLANTEIILSMGQVLTAHANGDEGDAPVPSAVRLGR